MLIVLYILTCLFAALHAFAAAVHICRSGITMNDILMICGALHLVLGIVMKYLIPMLAPYYVLIGSVVIILTAISNGRKSGDFHLQHHLIRFFAAALLTLGFFLL